MKIAVCEDEKYWSNAIEASIYRWASKRKVNVKCNNFFSPYELIEHVTKSNDTDVIFLDISLGTDVINGITAAEYIRKTGIRIPIIFVTVDFIHAADGYLVEAMGFLSKPIDEKRLALFLDRIIKKHKNEKAITIRTNNEIKKILQRDIIYVEVMNHTITYHTLHTEISQRGTLNESFNLLGSENFIQIHRAYIIPVDKIYSVKTTSPHSVNILKGVDTICLPVSRKYIKKLLDIYTDDILERMI